MYICRHELRMYINFESFWFCGIIICDFFDTTALNCMERNKTSALLKIKFISISNVYK